MRKTFYGLAFDQYGNTQLKPLTFTSAREAQDWADWQREHKNDATKYVVIRISPTKARP